MIIIITLYFRHMSICTVKHNYKNIYIQSINEYITVKKNMIKILLISTIV